MSQHVYEVGEKRIQELLADNERLRAVVVAIDERDPDKPNAWNYRREELVEMAAQALANAS